MKLETSDSTILVWDVPVRVFHWALAISFFGAWLTAEGDKLLMMHYAFGYSACALVIFRIVWGVIGTKYSRFSQFIKGPEQMKIYLKEMITLKKSDGPGHNPVGALVMMSLIVLILLIGLTGYWMIQGYLGELMGGAHEAIASIALGLVVIHIAAAIIMSLLHKENLIRSMVNGQKQGNPEQGIRYPMQIIGMCLAIAWVYSFYLVVSGALPGLTQ